MLSDAEASRSDRGAATTRDERIPADDGRVLAATLFAPSGGNLRPSAPLTVIAAGAGIPRRYYARFATYLAEQGRLAVTFDYRDIGDSRQRLAQRLQSTHARLVRPRRAGSSGLGGAHVS